MVWHEQLHSAEPESLSQDGNRLRGHPAFNSILVLVAITTMFLAQAARALPVGTQMSPTPKQVDQSTAAPTDDAPSVKPQPTDLHPRSLGANRENKPAISTQGETQSAASTLWNNPTIRTGGSLLLVLVLIFALASLAKRVGAKSASLAAALGPGGRAPEGLLEVVGRYPLARGQTLILLKLDTRILLLSQTLPRIRGGVGTLATLCEITSPEDVASILVKAGEHDEKSHTARFSALLHAFDRSHAPAAHEDHTELDPRSVPHTDNSDRAEPWEGQASPVLHKFPPARPTPVVDTCPNAAPHIPEFTPPHMAGTDSFSAIRHRLQALKGEAHR